MTLSTTSAVTTANGNGVTVAFNFPFLVPYQDGTTTPALTVWVASSTGVRTLKSWPADYTVSGINSPLGGYVNFTTAPALGTQVIIARTKYNTQPTAVSNQAFYPHTVETGLDQVTLLVQQLQAQVDASVRLPIGHTTAYIPGGSLNKVIGLDASGDLALYDILSGAAVPDASTMAYIAGGTSPVSQTVQARLRQQVILTDYVNPDGVTDATIPLANALAYCATVGRELYIPRGLTYYKLTDEITVPDDITITGPGWLKQTVAEKNIFIAGNNNTFRGIELEGIGTHTDPVAYTKNNGIFASSKKKVTVQQCTIHGFISSGVQFRNVSVYDISHNLIYGGWWTYPTGVTVVADISLYSDTDGTTGVIVGNRCLSNNSQGIMLNNQGFDHDITCVGNICVTMTDDLSGEVALANLQRRHGIVAGYGGGGGRFTVTANVCRNTLVTGIYHTANTTATHACVVSSNICSLNGLVTAGASDSTLAGGISMNGGGAQSITVFANSVYDFRGKSIDAVGAIMFNGDASANVDCQILNNVVDTSSTNGIMCKGTLGNISVKGNKVVGCTERDITFQPGASANLAMNIESNTCIRTVNATSCSIYVDPVSGVRRNYVRFNRLIGFNSATAGTANTGVYWRNTVPITVSDNYIENYQYGVFSENAMTGRGVDLYHIDRNDFKTCVNGIRMYGADNTFIVVFEDNTFSGVTTPYTAAGGFDSTFAGKRIPNGATTRVEIYGSAAGDYPNGIVAVVAGPKANQGTWVVGDVIKNSAPAALGSPGWVCTTAGTPATPNVVSKMANLI